MSCPTASFCAVVTGDGDAVTYNGQSWSSRSLFGSGVTDVSCASSTFCVAPDGHTVLSFNGSQWQTSATVDPTAYLRQVSCPSTTFCAATDSTGDAYLYDGTGWSGPMSVDPSVDMDALSGSSPTFCLALDDDDNAVTYNGSIWSSPTAVDPADNGADYDTVSCPTSQFCAAVSVFGNVVTYDGAGWSAPTDIDLDVGDAGLDLDGVSCSTALGACLAVDQNGRAFTFDGSSWSAPRSFDPIVGSLNDVACASSSFCLAVDTFGHVLTYDGSIWSPPTEIDPSPLFTGKDLGSVSCAPGSRIFCVVLDNMGQSMTDNGIGVVVAPGRRRNELGVLSDDELLPGRRWRPVEKIRRQQLVGPDDGTERHLWGLLRQPQFLSGRRRTRRPHL